METAPYGVPPVMPPEELYQALRADVASRLKSVCADWSVEEFEAIVEKVVRSELKYRSPTRRHLAPD